MSFFNLFRKKPVRSEADQKWDLLWEKWAEGSIDSPFAELMSYESEVNNGGHAQFFFNTANCSDLDEAVRRMLPVLPEPLKSNLNRAYEAFAAQAEIDSDKNDSLFEECDGIFYENEQLLLHILQERANRLSL